MRRFNSLFVWYPKVEGVVSTPKTVMIPMENDFESFGAAIDTMDEPEMNRLISEAKKAVNQLGGVYPVFLRSDETSNKHSWRDTCFVSSENELSVGIKNILEFTLMVTGNLSFGGVAVREFLLLPHEFTAFNGMPVSKEFRFFVKNGELLCWHPYWFPACMRRASCEDWLSKLRKIQVLYPSDLEVITDMALRVSESVECLGAPDNYWSIDFCWSKDYGWTLTDMALGKDSFHYNTCVNAPEEMKIYPDPETIPEFPTVNSLKAKRKRLTDLI